MTNILIPKKNVIMDSQLLTALMSCPLYFDNRFNKNLISIGGKGNSFEVGSIVHKFQEEYYKKQIERISKNEAAGYAFAAAQMYIKGCPQCTDFEPKVCPIHRELSESEKFDYSTCEDCQVFSKPLCGHPPNEYPGVHNTPKESKGYLIGWNYALDTCQQYLDYYKNDSWTPLKVEWVDGRVIYEDDSIRILWKAKFDAIMDTYATIDRVVPMDHKTMKQNRDTISLNNQFMGQCILARTNKVWINKIGFQKTLPAAEKFKRVPVAYSDDRLMEWQSEIVPYWAKQMIAYSESGYWPPNFGGCETKYGYCAFKEGCETDSTERERWIQTNFKIGPKWNPSNYGE